MFDFCMLIFSIKNVISFRNGNRQYAPIPKLEDRIRVASYLVVYFAASLC